MERDPAGQILEDFESSSPRLAWLVRALLLIGRQERSTREKSRLLELLQSLLGQQGEHPELAGAIEEVKRELPGWAELVAARESSAPANPVEDSEAVRQAAARDLLGAGATEAAATELRSLLQQITDPKTTREDRTRLQRQMNDMVLRSRNLK